MKSKKRVNGAHQARLMGHLYSAPGLQPTVLGKRVRVPKAKP
jgi:hypothetical protein